MVSDVARSSKRSSQFRSEESRLIGFTPAGRIEQFFRDLEKRGVYFGNGSPEDKELVHRLYGIVNVGPPLRL